MLWFGMAKLTDPTPAMASFQQAVRDGEVALQRAALDRDVFVYMDRLPGGQTRFAYARMDGQIVLAFANFITAGFEEGLPVFQIGVAVPETERGKGRAKHIIAAGIAELKHGLNRAHPGAAFYVEAVVGLDNVASQHVAAAVISSENPKPVTDNVSGLPALHFIRKV
jgi:hypothetical protein